MLPSNSFLLILFLLFSCETPSYEQKNPPRLVGGPCEGCEGVFEFGEKQLYPVDTLPDFNEAGQKIKVSGTIFKPDGKTPAPVVTLYVYHTNQQGVYPAGKTTTGWGKRHGDIRAWIQTDKQGRYTFYTLKPGIYPNRNSAAHIHPTILEPDGKYYWIESYLFEGDSLISEAERNTASPRGGHNGIISLKNRDGVWHGERNIILGRNIPDYE
ncbi:MAG: intradiol ring-cleavage dioxygenase [Owenweeksia sp.]